MLQERQQRFAAGLLGWAVLWLSFFLFVLPSPARAQAPEAPASASILILHSYDPTYNWSSEVTLGLKAAWRSGRSMWRPGPSISIRAAGRLRSPGRG